MRLSPSTPTFQAHPDASPTARTSTRGRQYFSLRDSLRGPQLSLSLTVGSSSQISTAVPLGSVASSTVPRAPVDVVTYSYASRMVYVAPAKTYDVRPLPIYSLPSLHRANVLTDLPSDASRMPSISPRSPSGSSRTSIASESASRLTSTYRKRMSPGRRRLGGRLGLSWLRRSPGSKSWKYAWPRMWPPRLRWHFPVLKLRPSSHLLIPPKRENECRMSLRMGHKSQARSRPHHHPL